MGLGAWGLGVGAWGLGLGAWGLGLRVSLVLGSVASCPVTGSGSPGRATDSEWEFTALRVYLDPRESKRSPGQKNIKKGPHDFTSLRGDLGFGV